MWQLSNSQADERGVVVKYTVILRVEMEVWKRNHFIREPSLYYS